jgi:hypothetical protein
MLPRTNLKILLAAGLAFGFVAGSGARADDVLPKALPANRYEKLAAHSPFAPPTVAAPVAPAPVAAPKGSWADKLAVTALMQNGGIYIATVVDRDSSQHFIVTSDKENERSMMLASVQWGDKYDQTRITIRRGAEFGQVAFDASAGAASAVMGPGAPVPPRPMIPGGPLPGAGTAQFHPPPGANPAFRGPQGPSNIVRRQPIFSTPAATPRPVFPRPTAKPAADDDDDDDDE